MSDDYKPVLRPGSDPLVFFGFGGGEQKTARGHIMASVLARELQDGDVVVVGANSLIPVAAARLAQLTHAPNLTLVAGASGGVNSLVEPLVPSSADYSLLIAEAVLSFDEVLMLQMGGATDVFFAGGLQIDRAGNCNLARVGDAGKPLLRGPGSAGVPWASRSGRVLLYTTSHSPRVFVPKVDFVSLPGWNRVAEVTAAPDLVITPLGVFDFDGGHMRVRSLHTDVGLEEVQANTGFELLLPTGEVPVTPEPTDVELQILRQLDLDGLLAIVV